MNEYTFISKKNPKYEIVVGWEPWLASYYCIVHDLSIDDEEANPWGILEEGTTNEQEIPTVEQLSQILIDYGVIPTEIVNYLKEDAVKEPPELTSVYSSEENIFGNDFERIKIYDFINFGLMLSLFVAIFPSIYLILANANIFPPINDNLLFKLKILCPGCALIIMLPLGSKLDKLDKLNKELDRELDNQSDDE